MIQDTQLPDVAKALAAPFPVVDVRFRPGPISGKRCLALAYVDARAIMDRLDLVLGIGGWQDNYVPQPGGTVMCQLRLKIDGHWVERSDVGAPSLQPDEGDRVKAAFSDALKRAAVKFGIGRYLYRLPASWVDFDPTNRRLMDFPDLPSWARPDGDGGDGECIGKDDQESLAKLLAERGKTPAGLCRWLGLPEGAGLGSISKAQYAAAVKTLRTSANGGQPNGKGTNAVTQQPTK